MTNGVAYTLEELDTNKKKVLEYLVKTAGGTFAAACKYANIPYSTAYEMRKVDPKWNEEVIAARKAADDLGGDFAESKLMEAINNNELTGVIFYLKTKHKARGYIERVEQDHTGTITHKQLTPEEQQETHEMLMRYQSKHQPKEIIDVTPA